MAGTWGGEDKSFTIPALKNDGAEFWTKTDTTTGKVTVYRTYKAIIDLGLRDNKEIGTIEPGGKFVPSSGFDNNLSADERKAFLSKDGQKQLKDKTEESTIKSCVGAGGDPNGCTRTVNKLLDTGKADGTSAFDDAETIATDDLNKLDIKENPKTRNTFGDFRYPITINDAQDVMQFVMLKYEARNLGSGENFGFGERERVGIDGGSRKIGSATLAIQGGISDLNGCDWGEDSMNLAQLELAKLAYTAMGAAPAEGLSAGIDSLLGRMTNVSDDIKKALRATYAGKAAGVQGLLKRTAGAILNPNLELLFDKPTLRPFTFTFKMSARSKKEADQIVKIIRFFKQGMAPRRSVGNLFLLAPHTFQVHYLAKGVKEHPYIGKMKECALMSLKTDYTPENNYATLPDGYMVSYQITMEMKELEPVFNDDYESDTEQQMASFREDPEENAKLQQDFLNGTANDPLPGEIGF